MDQQYVHLTVSPVTSSQDPGGKHLVQVDTSIGIWGIWNGQDVVEYLFERSKGWTARKANVWYSQQHREATKASSPRIPVGSHGKKTGR